MEEGKPAKEQEKEKFENWRKTGSIPAAKRRDCLSREGARCTVKIQYDTRTHVQDIEL